MPVRPDLHKTERPVHRRRLDHLGDRVEADDLVAERCRCRERRLGKGATEPSTTRLRPQVHPLQLGDGWRLQRADAHTAHGLSIDLSQQPGAGRRAVLALDGGELGVEVLEVEHEGKRGDVLADEGAEGGEVLVARGVSDGAHGRAVLQVSTDNRLRGSTGEASGPPPAKPANLKVLVPLADMELSEQDEGRCLMVEAIETRGARVSSVVRWKRLGKDRLYVNASDGHWIGWLDLSTGERLVARPALQSAFDQALDSWKAEQLAASEPRATLECASITTLPPPPSEAGQHAGRSPIASIVSLKRRKLQSPPKAEAETTETQSPGGGQGAPQAARLSMLVGSGGTRSGVAGSPTRRLGRTDGAPRRSTGPAGIWRSRMLATGNGNGNGPWRAGENGERLVARELAKLAAGWHVLNAIPLGQRGADIDHIVIGPAGVFVLNAKQHLGAKIWVAGNQILVNGHRRPYVRNSRHEARRVSRLLTGASGQPVNATGVVVFVNAGVFTAKSQPTDTHVINRLALLAWLQGLPQRLDAPEVARICDVAHRSSTWQDE